MTNLRWQFTCAAWTADPDRCRALERWQSDAEVIEAVVDSAVLLGTPAWELRKQAPAGASRLQLVFRADAHAVDALFNSRRGYRAAYAQSAQVGEAFNRQILAKLLDCAGASLDVHMRGSATDEAAKVWMRQDARQTSAMTGSAIYPVELDAQDWPSLLDEVVDTRRGRRWFARAGVLLGTANSLVVLKGGWRVGGEPWQDLEKRDRAIHLHRFGFT